MKKKLTPAKTPLPRFRSEEEAADYFQTHSVVAVWDQLPAAAPAKTSSALKKSIRERHEAAKSPISIRLDPEQIAAAKRIAAAKSVGYQTQLRMWIAEAIRREGNCAISTEISRTIVHSRMAWRYASTSKRPFRAS